MSTKKGIQLVVILLLAVALGFSSTAAFAYWTSSTRTSNVTIEFTEENASLIINQTSETFEGLLVPRNYALFENEVEEVSVTYEVSIDKTLVKEVNLVVEALNVMVGDSQDYSHLIKVEINGDDQKSINDLFNSTVLVTITITILEPIDQNEADMKGLDSELVNVENSQTAYDAIYGKIISFDLRFSIEQK